MSVDFGKPLAAAATRIPGLIVVDLPVHRDARGWFKENWQRERMTGEAIGLPDFGPVQNNVSFNHAAGTTRGIHAEPWDKYVSVATGRVFGAWVDLRDGDTFGAVHTAEIDPSTAVFVPRGVGNAYQTLEPETAYTYLVNGHWSATAEYTFLNLADETVAIDWPIPLDSAEISDRDRRHPRLARVVPMPRKKILVTGADGQLGRALHALYGDHPWIEYTTRETLDLTSPGLSTARRWHDFATIINAAAYTRVDTAETSRGRADAWSANVTAVAALARIAARNGITLVHISSDYVFDGTKNGAYTPTDPVSPLGVYGQTKAAADAIVSTVPRHYIVRTSWVIGEGDNFVRTMASLAERGAHPRVVDDQIGRLTFTVDIAAAVRRLLDTAAPYGTHHVSGTGAPATWHEIAQEVFRLTGHDPARVTAVSTEEYFAGSVGPVAPRPRNSVLEVDGVDAPWRTRLVGYLRAR